MRLQIRYLSVAIVFLFQISPVYAQGGIEQVCRDEYSNVVRARQSGKISELELHKEIVSLADGKCKASAFFTQVIDTNVMFARLQVRTPEQRKQDAKPRPIESLANPNDCITADPEIGNNGAFINSCDQKVHLSYCLFSPEPGKATAQSYDCDRQGFGLITANAKDRSTAYVKDAKTVYFVACFAPQGPTEVRFSGGRAIGRCK